MSGRWREHRRNLGISVGHPVVEVGVQDRLPHSGAGSGDQDLRERIADQRVVTFGFPGPRGSRLDTACTVRASEGMVVLTDTEQVKKIREANLGFILINHPLDRPICDKGGEWPLQNQAMSNGRAETRFEDVKRTYEKPIAISAQVLLDRERCVLCARCTRFSNQVAGDPFIELLERGALQQVGIYGHLPGAQIDLDLVARALDLVLGFISNGGGELHPPRLRARKVRWNGGAEVYKTRLRFGRRPTC